MHDFLCTVNEAALTTYNIGRTQTETIKRRLKKIAAAEVHCTATRAICVHNLGVMLPLIVQEGAMWLFPESKVGYTMKYELADEKVIIDRKPHDCEWETAPLGAKHCHYDKAVQTETGQHGKVTAAYVSWQKVQD